jgi:1-acyl-sn-glycerol-3-phosphate acyltransferase
MPPPSIAIPLPASLSTRVHRLPVFKMARLLRAFVHATWLVRRQFPRLSAAQQQQEIQRWARRVLAILEVEVACTPLPATASTTLVVCNHLSWLDVLVMQSLLPAVFVAKSEVQAWPVVGKLAQACATIFVQRASARSARAMVDSAATALASGHSVVAFPEGTSSDGSEVLGFHANIFECAIQADCAVLPVTLHYLDRSSGGPATAAHFIDDMTLLSSLRDVLASGTIQARVHLGAPIHAAGHTRKSLSLQAHASVRSQLPGAQHA